MGEFVDVGLYVGVMVAPDVIFLVASSMCLESSVQGLSRLLGLFFLLFCFFSGYCPGPATPLPVRRSSPLGRSLDPQISESGLFV